MKQMSFLEVADLMERYGIGLVASRVFDCPKETWDFIESLKKPVAIKLNSREIDHRTEVKGVFLNITGKEEFAEAWQHLSQLKGAEGVIVQEMRSGIELILGSRQDSQFGPVVMFGLGGILVELLQDVSFRIAPFGPEEALSMINEIKGKKILQGFRGHAEVNLDKLAEMISSLSYLVTEQTVIQEIDFNPVMANKDIIEAVDAKIWIAND
jgi:acyl-CoA synthetase (NDP forming)